MQDSMQSVCIVHACTQARAALCMLVGLSPYSNSVQSWVFHPTEFLNTFPAFYHERAARRELMEFVYKGF